MNEFLIEAVKTVFFMLVGFVIGYLLSKSQKEKKK